VKAYEVQKQLLEAKVLKKKEKVTQMKSIKEQENKTQGLMQETIKKGLEAKILEMQGLMNEEKKAREFAEQEKKRLVQE